MRRSTGGLAAVGVAAVLLTAACAPAADTKSGAVSDRVQLVLADSEANLAGLPAVHRFIDRVRELSGGRVTITDQYLWSQSGPDEARVVRTVADGKADFGSVGTRVLDQVGVTAFTPLHAPFLIDSYPAEAAVVADPQITALLSSLRGARVAGLALLADELSFPVGFNHALLTPQDYRGALMVTAKSGIQAEGLTQLGAVVAKSSSILPDLDPPLSGFESQWWAYASIGFAHSAPFPTVNTPLWPRTLVLFAHPDALARLTGQQRGWIASAAADAARWSVQHAADRTTAEIARACQTGAKVALASPEQTAALHVAVQPLYRRLRTDPRLGATFTRIEHLAATATDDPPPVLPAGCAYSPKDARAPKPLPRFLDGPGKAGDLPQGVYRYAWTEKQLLDQGQEPSVARGNAGVFTWTLRQGRWSIQFQPRFTDVYNTPCAGFYDVVGTAVHFSTVTSQAQGTCAAPAWAARWTFKKGRLLWSDVTSTERENTLLAKIWGVDGGWIKIG